MVLISIHWQFICSNLAQFTIQTAIEPRKYFKLMEKNLNQRPGDSVGTSAAVAARGYSYGAAYGIEAVITPQPILERESFLDKFKFYYGESISGVLFIFAVLCYTFFMPMTAVRPGKMILNMIDKSLKKALDLIGATIGLVLSLPLFIALPIIIKLESSGTIFYTQDRIGINRRRRTRRSYRSETSGERRQRERRREDLLGRPFKVIKFRTMVSDAEKASGPVWATKNDSRVTKIGRLMRKTRLDEIPQLINVLKGEMSLVGPRPERPFFVRDLSTKVPNYRVRLRVKPGITGLAQVNTGYDSSIDSVAEKVENDITYIRNWSILSDIRILMKTVAVVITGKGAC
jgi:lipopolysaccharide/colanic/teichoic acid biosynthesis glycosyltransferase